MSLSSAVDSKSNLISKSFAEMCLPLISVTDLFHVYQQSTTCNTQGAFASWWVVKQMVLVATLPANSSPKLSASLREQS